MRLRAIELWIQGSGESLELRHKFVSHKDIKNSFKISKDNVYL